MRDLKTIEDLREIFADELVPPRRGARAESAPFENPRIYQEDYVRHVLRVNIPLNESYPWSHGMRLLIEEEEEKTGNWFTNFFGGVFDFIVGLPGRVLGVLTALKDLMLDPGQIRALAKDEEERVKRFITAAKRSGYDAMGPRFNAAGAKLEAAVKRAGNKIRGTKQSMEAALGMVALALTVRYKGAELLTAFNATEAFKGEDVMSENLKSYRDEGLASVLFEARVKLSDEGKAAVRTIFKKEKQSATAIALIQMYVDADKYKPPSSFPDSAYGPYFANARKSILRSGVKKGQKLTEPQEKALLGIFDKIHASYISAFEAGKDFADPIIAGREFDFGSKRLNEAFTGFIESLDKISSGKPQSDFMDFWRFLGSLSYEGQSSGIGEGISMLWTLIRKYGKKKASKPESVGPEKLVKPKNNAEAEKMVDRVFTDQKIDQAAVESLGSDWKKLPTAEKKKRANNVRQRVKSSQQVIKIIVSSDEEKAKVITDELKGEE